jgi:hypothetical protein
MRNLFYFVFVGSGLVVGAQAGCSSRDFNLQGDGGPPDDTGVDTGVVIVQPPDASDGCANQCSDDLRSVLDCNGTKLQDCPSDKVCGAGMCVDPCTAAILNKSSIGCEYYTYDAPTWGDYAMFISNTSSAVATIAVEWGGASLDVSRIARVAVGTGLNVMYKPLTNGKELQPNEVAILCLFSHFDGTYGDGGFANGCPWEGANSQMSGPTAMDITDQRDTRYSKTFHVTTTAPVVAYQSVQFQSGATFAPAASASLLLPTSGWDTNYIAVTPWPKTNVNFAPPKLGIIGSVDGTVVTILPSANIVGGNGVHSATKNVQTTYTLDKGQLLQFAQDEELIGSVIQTTDPVGVFGGQFLVTIDPDCCADSEQQQIPPVRSLGSEYAAVKYKDRYAYHGISTLESVPWRIVGAVDGTTLTWKPSTPAGAPTALKKGQAVTFNDPGNYTVSSQGDDHPFYLGYHMTGGHSVTPYAGGDPEWQNLITPAAWLSNYIFFMDPTFFHPGLTGNMSISMLVFTRKKKMNSTFDDVTLDCKGTLTGWTDINGTDYQFAYVDMAIDGVGVGGCDTGRHTASSNSPFGLQVWGWTADQSYAYPGGMDLRPKNNVVVNTNPN